MRKNKNLYADATIEAVHVGRRFPVPGGSFEALKDIHVKIPEGKLTILKGRSGSGKTTLMNILGALDAPTKGKVLIGGRDIGKLSERARDNLRRTQMGFVFQAVSLIPSLNAFQNVEFSMRMAGKRKNRKARVEECLKMVGLGNRMNHMPMEMSGGEQQRVAIARAIAHNPKIIFADEPTAELDSAMAAEVTRLLWELTRKEGVTIVMTTHDTGLMDAGDILIELENGTQVSVTEVNHEEALEGTAADATTGSVPETPRETAGEESGPKAAEAPESKLAETPRETTAKKTKPEKALKRGRKERSGDHG